MAVLGTTFAVRVTQNARRASLDLVDGAFRISVIELPEAGRATDAACARVLGMTKTRLILLRGLTTRHPLFCQG